MKRVFGGVLLYFSVRKFMRVALCAKQVLALPIVYNVRVW